MNESGTGPTATPVEERLQAALAARAYSIGPADLRPLGPPTGAVRSRRVLVRRTVAGMLVLAAVAALVFFSIRREPTHPVEPARPSHTPADTRSPGPANPTNPTIEPARTEPRP